MRKKLILIITLLFFISGIAFAHQPRIEIGVNNSERNPINIEDPEISKAYYGKLKGQPDYYRIVSDKPFSLYVNILAPNIPIYNETRFSVEVKDITGKQIILLNGTNSTWQEFFEPFGQDFYLQGPEARMNVSQGLYYIKVFNSNNTGRYSLAVGEEESFPPIEILKSVVTVPILKTNFFNKPFYTIFINIAGVFWIAIIAVVVVIFFIVKRMRKSRSKRK